MYPDTTGGAFDRGVPPPPLQPVPPVAGAAWIPAQRSPWEPPPRQQGEPLPPVPVPAQPEGTSGGRPTAAGPMVTPASAPVGATDPADGVHNSVDASVDAAVDAAVDGVEIVEPDRPETAEAAETTQAVGVVEAVETAVATEPATAEESEPEEVGGPKDAEAVKPEGTDAEAPEPPTEAARALRPGDLPQARIALWAGASAEAEAFRERIREAGSLFVDDPNFAVTATAAVVTEAVTALAAALARQHAELDPRHSRDNPDTEELRVAVLRYRELLDRVLAL